MNKLKVTIAGLLIACLGAGVINAQDNSKATPAATQTPAQKSTKKSTTTKATTGTKAAPAPAGQHLKKDGTPDMRFKENKAASGKPTSPPLKKSTTKKATTPTTPPANNSGK